MLLINNNLFVIDVALNELLSVEITNGTPYVFIYRKPYAPSLYKKIKDQD